MVMRQLSNKAKGILEAVVSSASFGLIPLFSVPLLALGMTSANVLIYRYGLLL